MTAAAQSQGCDPGSGPVWGHSLLAGAAAWPPTKPPGRWSGTAGRPLRPAPWLPATTWLAASCQGCRQSGLPPTASAGSGSGPCLCRMPTGTCPLQQERQARQAAGPPRQLGRRPARMRPRQATGPRAGGMQGCSVALAALLELPGLEKQPNRVQGALASWAAGLWSKTCATRWPSASPKFASLTEPPRGRYWVPERCHPRAWKDTPPRGTRTGKKTTAMAPRASEVARHLSLSASLHSAHTLHVHPWQDSILHGRGTVRRAYALSLPYPATYRRDLRPCPHLGCVSSAAPDSQIQRANRWSPGGSGVGGRGRR